MLTLIQMCLTVICCSYHLTSQCTLTYIQLIICLCYSIDDQPDSEEEGEDLEEHWLDDYVAQPELDQYDADVLDDQEYESMTREQREAAEKVMEEREARGDSGDRQAQADCAVEKRPIP